MGVNHLAWHDKIIFMKFIGVFLKKSVEKIQILLKSDTNGYLM